MSARAPIEGACVWTGDEAARSDGWKRPIPAPLAAGLIEAAGAAKARGLDWFQVRREDFALPGIEAFAADVREELENGWGMVKLTGLDLEGVDPGLHQHLWFGLGQYLGQILSQNWQGELMRAIRDEGYKTAVDTYGATLDEKGQAFLSSGARTITTGPLRFHTDRCDVVALFCVGQAARGGDSLVCSTPAVHNAILRQCPDLLEVLYRPIPRTRFGEEKDGGTQIYNLPVFGVRDGRLTSHYSRTYIENGQQLADAPRMTEKQWEALDLLDATARELAYSMRLAKGEIQLLNNHVIYHARTGFENDASQGLVRSLLRLWFAMPNSRALPEDHAVLWGSVESGTRRGGIAIAA